MRSVLIDAFTIMIYFQTELSRLNAILFWSLFLSGSRILDEILKAATRRR